MPKDWIDEAAKNIADWEFEMFRGEPYCEAWIDHMAQIIREAYQRHVSDPKPMMAEYPNPPTGWKCFPQTRDGTSGQQFGDAARRAGLPDGST